MSKPIIKYFLQFIVIVLIGAGIFFGIGYYRYRTSPEYRKYQDLLAQKERYMADTYGGDTPEETLELFISALKAGDIELASKYFMVEEREARFNKFTDVKNSNLIDEFIGNLEKAELKEVTLEKAVFSYKIKTEGGRAIVGGKEIPVPAGVYSQTITISINTNGVWKIISM